MKKEKESVQENYMDIYVGSYVGFFGKESSFMDFLFFGMFFRQA